MATKKRPPMVEVKLSITKAVLEYTKDLADKDASPLQYFPNGWYHIVDKAIEEAYEAYPNSERHNIEVELERLDNAFKQ